MTAWRRAVRWLMLALSCAALATSAVPASAQAQVEVAAQVEVLARKAERAAQARAVRSRRSQPLHVSARAGRILVAPAQRRPELSQLPAPPGRLYLTHRALLR